MAKSGFSGTSKKGDFQEALSVAITETWRFWNLPGSRRSK
jgi:hypothetical protein